MLAKGRELLNEKYSSNRVGLDPHKYYYIIDSKWFQESAKRISNGSTPKPINNISMRRPHDDYYVVSEDFWKCAMLAYGGGPEIKRPVVKSGVLQKLVVDPWCVEVTFVPEKGLELAPRFRTYVMSFPHDALKKDLKRALAQKLIYPPHKLSLIQHFNTGVAQLPDDYELGPMANSSKITLHYIVGSNGLGIPDY